MKRWEDWKTCRTGQGSDVINHYGGSRYRFTSDGNWNDAHCTYKARYKETSGLRRYNEEKELNCWVMQEEEVLMTSPRTLHSKMKTSLPIKKKKKKNCYLLIKYFNPLSVCPPSKRHVIIDGFNSRKMRYSRLFSILAIFIIYIIPTHIYFIFYS